MKEAFSGVGIAYLGMIVLASLYCLADWRRGLYVCMVIDVLRDPLRKMIPSQSILYTLLGCIPWLAMIAGAMQSERAELLQFYKRYRTIATARQFILIALIPAALLSCIWWRGGWKLAAVGAFSYLAPLAGLSAGFLIPATAKAAIQPLKFYVLLNSLAFIGGPLELTNVNIPGLRSLHGDDWVRNRTGYEVDLICGFYRSPDIMGLHAANTIMFSLLIAQQSRSGYRFGWYGLASWAAANLLLSGRRKMLAMPLLYLASSQWIAYLRGRTGQFRYTMAFGLLVAVAVGGLLLFGNERDAREYTDYAATTVTEANDRVQTLVLGSVISTLQQVGVLGGGLGTGTQGRYYLGVQTTRAAKGWQEDGISRLFLELGVFGVVLILMAIWKVWAAHRIAIKLVPPQDRTQGLQIGLSGFVLASAGSYMIAHQHFSGDPVGAIMVTLISGMILGAPRIYARDLAIREAYRRTNQISQQTTPGEATPLSVP